jgi:DNA-binding transcriptional MerR regulator
MEKSPEAFRTISEVAHELDVPQHVLRFWETRFGQIKPMKRGGGRRYYRPDDVDLLRGIRHLLYGEGYTIRGVQRILKEEGVKFVQTVWRNGAPQPQRRADEGEEAGDEGVPTVAGGQEGSRGLLGLWPSILGASEESDEAHPADGDRIEPSLGGGRMAVARGKRGRDSHAESADGEDMDEVSGVPVAASGLPREHVRALQSALFELGECRRLLEVALGQNA